MDEQQFMAFDFKGTEKSKWPSLSFPQKQRVGPDLTDFDIPILKKFGDPMACIDGPLAQTDIDNFTFTPQEITITRGATVTWVNDDDIPHAIAASDKAFRSKAMDTEEKFSFKFNEPGTYEYFCSLHPHMQGKVIVKD